MTEYIDINMMAEKLFGILRDARDDFKDGSEDDAIIDEYYDDETLHVLSLQQSLRWNDDMQRYLHMDNRHIDGNFKNIDYDYPCFRTGEIKYDDNLVNDMIKRLDDACNDEQSRADRIFLVEWFFETFGTYGITYNFQSRMSDTLYASYH